MMKTDTDTNHDKPTRNRKKIRAARALELMREKIGTGEWEEGKLIPTEAELAEAFGIARGTLRTALSVLEAEGMFSAKSGRGRILEKSGAKRKAPVGIVGESVVLFSDVRADARMLPGPTLNTASDSAIDTGVMLELNRRGLHMLTMNPAAISENVVRSILHDRPRGIVVRTPDMIPGDVAAHFRAAGIPLVFYGNDPRCAKHDRVTSDHAAGARMLVDFLHAAGCRRILRVWEDDCLDLYWLKARDAAVNARLRKLGLPVLEPVVVSHHRDAADVPADERFAWQTNLYRHYLAPKFARRDERPDALMPVSDIAFFPIAAACRAMGLTPGADIRITGYDNYWGRYGSRLYEDAIPAATIDKRNLDIGAQLVATALARAAGELPDAPQLVNVAPRLIVGN